MKTQLIHLFLASKEIADEYMVVSFVDNGVIYVITEVNETIRVYHSERHVPIVMDRFEAVKSGLLMAMAQILANVGDDVDGIVLGSVGRHSRELMKISGPQVMPQSFRLVSLGEKLESFFYPPNPNTPKN